MFVHLSGLVLGVGAATVKVVLILKFNYDLSLVPSYLKFSKVITRIIVLGLLLLTLSGVGLMFLGAQFTPLLAAKLVLVAAIWGIGPFVDRAIEPKLARLAPALGEEPTAEFLIVQKKHLALETVAIFLFYGATIVGSMV